MQVGYSARPRESTVEFRVYGLPAPISQSFMMRYTYKIWGNCYKAAGDGDYKYSVSIALSDSAGRL